LRYISSRMVSGDHFCRRANLFSSSSLRSRQRLWFLRERGIYELHGLCYTRSCGWPILSGKAHALAICMLLLYTIGKRKSPAKVCIISASGHFCGTFMGLFHFRHGGESTGPDRWNAHSHPWLKRKTGPRAFFLIISFILFLFLYLFGHYFSPPIHQFYPLSCYSWAFLFSPHSSGNKSDFYTNKYTTHIPSQY